MRNDVIDDGGQSVASCSLALRTERMLGEKSLSRETPGSPVAALGRRRACILPLRGLRAGSGVRRKTPSAPARRCSPHPPILRSRKFDPRAGIRRKPVEIHTALPCIK
jgi:hypothetical protein